MYHCTENRELKTENRSQKSVKGCKLFDGEKITANGSITLFTDVQFTNKKKKIGPNI